MHREQKYCIVCGRQMAWRARWRRNWHQVRYCSKACRRKGLNEVDRQLETVIMELLDEHPNDTGMPIQEVTAKMAAASVKYRQPQLLLAARNAARGLHNRGTIDVIQQGRRVNPSFAKGPFWVRRRM